MAAESSAKPAAYSYGSWKFCQTSSLWLWQLKFLPDQQLIDRAAEICRLKGSLVEEQWGLMDGCFSWLSTWTKLASSVQTKASLTCGLLSRGTLAVSPCTRGATERFYLNSYVLTAVAVTGKDGIYLSKKQCYGSGYGKNHSGSGQPQIRNEFEVKQLW